MAETGDRVTRKYGGFRGVDFRGDEINIVRSPDSLNVWKDYKETESIRTRPGIELKNSFDDTVYGIFFFNNMLLVHSGTKLYKVVGNTKTVLYTGLNRAKSNAFVYNNSWHYKDGKYFQFDGQTVWYFKDGKHYLQYDGQTIKDVVGYTPTTSIARKPSGGGKIHEEVNLLSEFRINTFLGDGISSVYYLDAQNIDDIESVVVDGREWVYPEYEWVVDKKAGKITFEKSGGSTPPPAPLTDGQDNVVITFRKKVDKYPEKIKNCTLLQVFDNRVFFSGNKEFPNTVWHCSLNNPSYCADLDYYNEGLDTAAVKGLVAGNNALWVFREPSQANTTVFYHTPTIDGDQKIYPNTHSSITTGCVGKAINFNDDIVFFSDRGMEGISGDVTTEQVVAHRSTLVDRKLIADSDYKDMLLEEWEGYLLVFVGDKVYLADSRAVFTNTNHIEYEWFYWQLEKKITCTKVYNGVLYLGTEDGVYTMTDNDCDVESYWVTAKDKFDAPQKLKTTNKRGCVVEATGDISVYAKLEDTDFEHIGTYENITDFFVSRIKRKKFKDIQLKFYSKTRFSLETATLEAFIGGYIKR